MSDNNDAGKEKRNKVMSGVSYIYCYFLSATEP